jgi:hypothetical protein
MEEWQSGLMRTIGGREMGESSFRDSNSFSSASFIKGVVMGIGIMSNSYSAYDKKPDNTTVIERIREVPAKKKVKLPNPDPYNWILNNSLKIGRFLLIHITYPDCTNYEGKKIMLYKNVTLQELEGQKTIDPHFSSNKKFHSPIARFEPTNKGWEMGKKMMEVLRGEL